MLMPGGEVWLLKVRGCGNSWGRPFCESTPTGDMPPWKPNPGDLTWDGEDTCEVGVAWNCGDATPYAPSRCDMPKASGLEAIPAGCLCPGRGPGGPGADLGGIGFAFAEAPGAPVFKRSSACTSIPGLSSQSFGVQLMVWEVDPPFSRRIRSNREFLYRNIKHSSAALR